MKADIVIVAGWLLLLAGTWLISAPWALVVGGASLMLAGLAIAAQSQPASARRARMLRTTAKENS